MGLMLWVIETQSSVGKMRKHAHGKIVRVFIAEEELFADLEDGSTISVPCAWYPRLNHGSPAERANFQISGAGYGIHWPDLDEDLGVEGLLLGKKSSESQASFER